MPDLIRKAASTSNILRVMLRHSTTFQGITGLYGNSTNLIISTIADVEATASAYAVNSSKVEGIAALGTYAAPTASDKCRFAEVDATNHPGLYELQLTNARFAVTNAKSLHIAFSGATNLQTADFTVQLTKFDPDDAVRAGLTALPNAVAGANTGLPLGNASGHVTLANGAHGGALATMTMNGDGGFTAGETHFGGITGTLPASFIAAANLATDIPAVIWNPVVSDFNGVGTFGGHVSQIHTGIQSLARPE
jgi:hypothetical protein